MVQGRDADVNGKGRPAGQVSEHVDIAHDERAAGDQRTGVVKVGERFQAGAREPVSAFGGLVGIGCGTDRNRLSPPAAPPELLAKDAGNVGLDAYGAPVAGVGGPVRPLLEGTHVAERAAVLAAHVGVQRPVERHTPDAVQG